MKYLFIALLFIFSTTINAAECKVNGRWYPYSSPMCSGQDTKSESTAKTEPVTATQNPVCKIPSSRASTDIKANLRKKYATSYSLQKTLLDANMKAYNALCSEPATDVNVQILEKRLLRYYPNFSLIQTLYEADKKAYMELNK